MPGATYDTGALVAAERNDRSMWAIHAELLEDQVIPVVPAPVLAQAWRGGQRQVGLSRLLALCSVEDMTEKNARAIGALAGRSDHADIVDLAVIECAARRGNAVVTADADDMGRIAHAAGARIDIIAL